MLPKIRYKRSTKKVDIEEIVKCIEEYCDSMISYLRNSNVSLLEHIMLDRIDFERTKDIATESLKDLKDGKMSMSECANKILKGDGKHDSNATGGIELISQSVTKSYTLLERIQQTSLPELKKL